MAEIEGEVALTPCTRVRMLDHVLVQILLYPGVQPLDLVGPHEVFDGANRWLQVHRPTAECYELELVGSVCGPVVGESGLALVAQTSIGSARTRPHTLMIPGGGGVYDARHDPALIAWCRAAAASAERVTSVCSGAFLLAEAGLLDGRRVATHWSRVDRLRREYPAVDVDPDPIFVRDGNVWTSAGVTAGIDLALALVECDHGAEVAQNVARHLVLFLRRPGGQSQFAAPVWSDPAGRIGIRAAQELVHRDPAGDLTVRTLADEAGMSERHFTRVFLDEIGCSPARYVERVRVDAARNVLERGDDGLDAVARRCGFGSTETFRRAFVRQTGVAPGAYRERFRLDEPPTREEPKGKRNSQ